MGDTRGEVGKSGVLKHKSGNISETHKDRDSGKVTMEYGEPIGSHKRSSPSARLGFTTHPKTAIVFRNA